MTNINTTAREKLAAYSLVTTFVIATFHVGVGVTLIYLSLWALLILVTFFITQSQLKNATLLVSTDALSVVCWAYLSWMIINYFLSQYREVSFYSTWAISSLPITFLLWKIIPNKDQAWRIFLTTFLIIGIVSGLWGCYDFITQTGLFSTKETSARIYINGQMLDPNSYAALLNAILIPITARFLTSNTTHTRIDLTLNILAIYFMTLAIFLTTSRAVFLLWAMLSLLLIVFIIKEKKLALNKILIWATLSLLAWLTFQTLPSDTFGFDAVGSKSTIESRLLMIQSAWQTYLQFPLTGTGLGTFRAFYSGNRSQDEIYTSGDLAHNDYIQFLQEGGPLQFLFLLILVCSAIYFSLKLFFSRPQVKENTDKKIETFSLLIVLLGLSAHALVNFIFYILALSVIFGIYLSRASDYFKLEKIQTITLPVRSGIVKLILVLLLFFPWSLLLIDTLIFDAFSTPRLPPPVKILHFADEKQRLDFAILANALRSKHSIPKHILVSQYVAALPHITDQQKKDEMIAFIDKEYEEILSANPISSYTYFNWAKHLSATGRTQEAEQKLLKSISLNPGSMGGYIALANLYANQGNYNKAIKLLLVDASKWITIGDVYSTTRSDLLVLLAALALAQKEGHIEDIETIAHLVLERDPENEQAKDALNDLKNKIEDLNS